MAPKSPSFGLRVDPSRAKCCCGSRRARSPVMIPCSRRSRPQRVSTPRSQNKRKEDTPLVTKPMRFKIRSNCNALKSVTALLLTCGRRSGAVPYNAPCFHACVPAQITGHVRCASAPAAISFHAAAFVPCTRAFSKGRKVSSASISTPSCSSSARMGMDWFWMWTPRRGFPSVSTGYGWSR